MLFKYNILFLVIIILIISANAYKGKKIKKSRSLKSIDKTSNKSIDTTSKKSYDFNGYDEIVAAISNIVKKENSLPLQFGCTEITEENDVGVTIVAKIKQVTSIFYEEPGLWRRCTRSCQSKRIWFCKHSHLCAKEIVHEMAYCYFPDSKCEEKVKTILNGTNVNKIDHLNKNVNDNKNNKNKNNKNNNNKNNKNKNNNKNNNKTDKNNNKNTIDDYEIVYEILYDDIYESSGDSSVDYSGADEDYNDNNNDDDGNGDDDDFHGYNDYLFGINNDSVSSLLDYDIDLSTVVMNRKKYKGEGKCGVPKVKQPHDLLRIIGGIEAPKGVLPWQVAVQNRYKETHCGGALIAPNWVLTAAHCTRKKLFVKLAEHDIRSYDIGEIELKVEAVYKHPLYDVQTIDSDIALLKLSENVSTRGKLVRTICLPELEELPPRNHKCIIAGWGKEKETHIFGSDILIYTQVPINSKKVCRNAYPDHPLSTNMFCAGYKNGGKDACSGDSGSPLVCQDSNQVWKVHGITSFGEGCGDKGKMGVYVMVNNFLPWIYHTMNINK